MRRIPTQYHLKFQLIDAATQKVLGTFHARRIRDRQANASFVNGNIASGGQSMSIATPDLLPFASYKHQVQDLDFGFTYMITSVRGLTHEPLGRPFSAASTLKEVVLELE